MTYTAVGPTSLYWVMFSKGHAAWHLHYDGLTACGIDPNFWPIAKTARVDLDRMWWANIICEECYDKVPETVAAYIADGGAI